MSRPGKLRREPEQAQVDAMAHDGRGIARVEGKAVFVPGALVGEQVLLQRTRRRRGHDEAQLREILVASPLRVQPGCAYFGVCGGCALQHLDHGAQLQAKERVLLDSLRRIGHVEPERVLPPLAGAPWQYRRRARLAARWVPAKGRVLLGFRERASSFITDMRSCSVLAPPAGELIGPLADLLGELAIRARVPQIEVAVADNQTALVLRALDPPSAADRALLARFAQEHGVRWYLQLGGAESVQPLADAPPVPRYRLAEFDLELEFAPTDFVQINGALNAGMVSRALELLAPAPADRVLDLYCGIGNFSLPLARRAAAVTAVEGVPALVERARSNARRNRLGNLEAHVADLDAPDVGLLPWARRRYDLVLLDPPRTGAGAVLTCLPAWQPRRVVYVSCDPATLARDAGALVQALGLRLRAAGIIDMFPHTAHVEAVALFEAGR